MMLLLVIPALELLSLSTISLRNSSLGAAAAIARSNARLALMMAVGELQKEMGPDSKISAPSEMASSLPGSQLARPVAELEDKLLFLADLSRRNHRSANLQSLGIRPV
ncbi:MAG: hypothetical protein CFE26_17635 [Verrucomicrobiales bacterium VVV1]|nr:MAG: hypothetical protein CFE26_17635 [Verrucomicrobiales bacterium VVV1]